MKNQLNSLHQRQTILKILIFTLVTAVIWVGLSLFRTQQRTEIDPVLIKLSEPLNPNISTEVLQRIEEKKSYTAEELSDFPVYSIVADKENGEQVVVFNASDRSKRTINLENATASPSPTASPIPVGSFEDPNATLSAQPAVSNQQPAPQSPTSPDDELPLPL